MPVSGDLLIIMAQIIVATQMVYEERFVTKHNVPPLQAVGWEGKILSFLIKALFIKHAEMPLFREFPEFQFF